MTARRGGKSRGSGLMEMVAVLAISALLAAAAVPWIGEMRARARLGAAAREVAGRFRWCRSESIARGRSVALYFESGPDGYTCWMHEDSDGDGISLADVLSGRDARIGGPWRLGDGEAGVDYSILPRPSVSKIPPQSGPLSNLVDPIKFGVTDLVTFTPRGTATGGTAYLSDGIHSMAAVVLYGPTGRVRVWRYLDGQDRWVQ